MSTSLPLLSGVLWVALLTELVAACFILSLCCPAMGLPEPAVSQCEASASGEHLSEVLQVAFVLPEACLLFLVVTFLLHQEVEFPLVSLATWFFPVWLPLFSIFY